MEGKLKIFISWSGDVSHKVALIMRDWLPKVIQLIDPYVSSEDTDKGTRSLQEISRELEISTFGIICITKSNVNEPWINFEAGAISKLVGTTKVSPLLIGLKRTDIKGPLTQFQNTLIEKKEIKDLLISINKSIDSFPLEEKILDEVFETWWPSLEKLLNPINIACQNENEPKIENDPSNKSHSEEILEEILEITRSYKRIIEDPEQLLPREYLVKIIRYSKLTSQTREFYHPAYRDLLKYWDDICMNFDFNQDDTLPENLKDDLIKLNKPIRFLTRTLQKSKPDLFDNETNENP